MAITLHAIESAYHSIQVKGPSGNAMEIDASGNVGIHDGGNTITVDATALDIRALTNADVVTAEQGTDPWVIGDGGNSITVDATALDIRALTNADVVTVEQGTSPWVVSGAVSTTPEAYDVWQVSQVTVTNAATQIAATPLTGRLNVVIQNLGSKDVFLKNTNGVSVSDLLLAPDATMEIALGPSAAIYGITASGTSDIRIAEFAA